MFAGSAGEALATSQILPDTRGHTEGEKHGVAGVMGRTLAISQTSFYAGEEWSMCACVCGG